MDQKLEMTRRILIAKFGRVAGGLMLSGSAIELLQGCGGGTSTGPSTGTGTTGAGAPTLPALPQIKAVTPAQAVAKTPALLGASVGAADAGPAVIAGGGTDSSGVVANPNVVAQSIISDPANLVFPSFSSAGNATLGSASQQALTQADLQTYADTLVTSGLLGGGDRLEKITFTQAGVTYNTIAILNSDGTVKYNPVLDAVPPSKAGALSVYAPGRLAKSTPTTSSSDGSYVVRTDDPDRFTGNLVITARNPSTGRTQYELTISITVSYDANNNINGVSGSATATKGNFVEGDPDASFNTEDFDDANGRHCKRGRGKGKFHYRPVKGSSHGEAWHADEDDFKDKCPSLT